MMKMPQKGEYVRFKYYEIKIKLPFMIYENIFVQENNGKQNPEDSYLNKFQEHVACSYGYKLPCVNDKFSKSIKPFLVQDTIYNFINSKIEESKFCTDIMKKQFNKELVMTEEDDKDFESSNKCWSCGNAYVEGDVKVRDHCYITGKYGGFAHRDCNIKVKLNHRIPIVFHNLKNYDSCSTRTRQIQF